MSKEFFTQEVPTEYLCIQRPSGLSCFFDGEGNCCIFAPTNQSFLGWGDHVANINNVLKKVYGTYEVVMPTGYIENGEMVTGEYRSKLPLVEVKTKGGDIYYKPPELQTDDYYIKFFVSIRDQEFPFRIDGNVAYFVINEDMVS